MRAGLAAVVGPWDEHLGAGAEFPAGEDTDYKLRLEALGVRMLATPRSVIHHSSGRRVAREAWRSQRNYAFGNGALAAKLTLADDRQRKGMAGTDEAGVHDGMAPSQTRTPASNRRPPWRLFRGGLLALPARLSDRRRRRAATPLLRDDCGARLAQIVAHGW